MKISKVTITIASTLASAILLTGCGTNSANSQTTQSSTSDNQVTMTYDQLRSRENTMSTLWYQKAAETKALYLQGETALPQKNGDVWVKKAAAKAVPGAKDFLQFADQNGVQIYYVSDRTIDQVDDTIKNLENEGIPVQSRDHLMFLEKGVKSKEGRRQAVQEKTNLVMLLGDNLVDFAEFSKTSETERDQKLEELQKEFGEKFIIFPNPMYGSWESTVYNGNKLDAKGQTEERQKNLQGFDK